MVLLQTWIPNFMKVDSQPFHPNTYLGPDQLGDGSQARDTRDTCMSIKLEVKNIIRWRWFKDEDGGYARIVFDFSNKISPSNYLCRESSLTVALFAGRMGL